MTNLIWERIANVSWVTYAFFIYIIIIGFKSTKPSVISIRSLRYMACLFFILSLIWFYSYIHLTMYNLFILITTIFLGTLLGWLHFRLVKVKAIKNQQQIRFPGSWLMLIVTFALLISMFYLDLDFFSFSLMITTPAYALSLLALYGLFTGLYIGRLIYSVRSVKNGPYALS